jgi:hypothetical protein
MVSTTAAVTAFLVFLLFAVQLTVNLYARSTVAAAGYDAARAVAGSDVDHTDAASITSARRRAERILRDLLGELGDHADLRWEVGTEAVRLRIVAVAPGILPTSLVGGPGLRRIERTFVVRIEQPR